MNEAYALAQRAMADLKSAIHMLLMNGPSDGLRNSDLGRSLGIYAGHVEHEGHISRTLLALMEKEVLWNRIKALSDGPSGVTLRPIQMTPVLNQDAKQLLLDSVSH